jgi:3-oxoacyl-[acyl-carrier protein] reductase
VRHPDLAGRVAVVTGASGSIGSATARFLAANRMRVAAVARNPETLEVVREEAWNRDGEVIAVPADCTDPASLRAAHEKIRADLGTVSVLVTFAGGYGRPRPWREPTLDDWRQTLDGDLTSTFLTIQEFVPDLVESGGGTIVTMSSAAGRQPARASLAYGVAKAGVVMLTRQLAADLAGDRIRINCVAPSAVHNGKMDAAMSPEQVAELGRSFPLGRIGEPADIAEAVGFLASEASGWITGVTLDIAGGKVIPG